MAASVLMQALMGSPLRAGNVDIGGRLAAIPVGDPEVIGLLVCGAVLRDEIDNAGRVAAVNARLIAAGVQLRGPGPQEREHGGGVAGRAAVPLHIEVDRVTRPQADRLGLCHGVDGGGGALAGSVGGGDRRATARVRRRLQAHVDRHQVPARRDLLANPCRGQVELRAGHVGSADVHPDPPVGRRAPGRHLSRAGRRAGIEAQAGIDGRGLRGSVRARRLDDVRVDYVGRCGGLSRPLTLARGGGKGDDGANAQRTLDDCGLMAPGRGHHDAPGGVHELSRRSLDRVRAGAAALRQDLTRGPSRAACAR